VFDPQLIDQILNLITDYGLWVLGLDMLIASAALPIPIAPLLIAAGALIRQGLFTWPAVFSWSLAGAVLGDIISYGLGRFAGDWADQRIGSRFGEGWQKAQTQFKRYGSWAIFLSRWFLREFDVPFNLIAGATRYDFKLFLIYATLGRVLWIALFIGMGYAFSSQYQLIEGLIKRYTSWFIIFLVMGIVIYIVYRMIQKKKKRTLVTVSDHSDTIK